MNRSTPRHLVAPLVGTGLLMAAYLLLRPYGDFGSGTTMEAAEAFGSTAWIVSHLCGALALASVGRLALRLHDLFPGTLTAAARWSGLVGTVLVLPYYGAETFGLHAVGRAAVDGSTTTLELVDPIRNHPAALTTFGLGLLLLAVSGIAAALAWQRRTGSSAAWPLGLLVALVLPQFYLPPAGRMAFGVLYAVAAAWWLLSLRRTTGAAPA
ncbi:MAG: hypothetical protein Q4G67_15700 [Actinomycetia bacterium]|nr:hypothetical protein [Actinomycetes bacterium]